MLIKDLKELKKLLVLCRQQGVESIKIADIEFHLGKAPAKAYKPQAEVLTDPLANASVPKPNIYNEISEVDKIEMPDELTDEQLMNWSSRPEAFEGQQ